MYFFQRTLKEFVFNLYFSKLLQETSTLMVWIVTLCETEEDTQQHKKATARSLWNSSWKFLS